MRWIVVILQGCLISALDEHEWDILKKELKAVIDEDEDREISDFIESVEAKPKHEGVAQILDHAIDDHLAYTAPLSLTFIDLVAD